MTDTTKPNAVLVGQPWITLRDYFAAQAITNSAEAICDALMVLDRDRDLAEEFTSSRARAAYMIADAMIRAREKRGEKP